MPCKASIGIVLSAILLLVVLKAQTCRLMKTSLSHGYSQFHSPAGPFGPAYRKAFSERLATLVLAHLCFLGTGGLWTFEVPRIPLAEMAE